MSESLEKWRGNLPATLENRIEEWRRRRAQELALRPPRLPDAMDVRSRGGNSTVPMERGSVIDLPRVCAVHDQLWCARYIRRSSKPFEYSLSVHASERLRQIQYAADNARVLPAGFRTGIEECPWCGAFTPDGSMGAAFCYKCKARVCYGRTSRSGYIYCRASCGSEGQLMRCDEPEIGVIPELRRYGNAAGR
jgi:hypothetical protein